MIFGLPVTGLGGLFYLLLTLWMPVQEAGRAVRGKSCPKRWGMILVQIGLMIGLFATLVGQAWLINRLIPGAAEASNQALGMDQFETISKSQTGGLVAGAVVVSLITLAVVAVLVHVLRLTLSLRDQLARRNVQRA